MRDSTLDKILSLLQNGQLIDKSMFRNCDVDDVTKAS